MVFSLSQDVLVNEKNISGTVDGIYVTNNATVSFTPSEIISVFFANQSVTSQCFGSNRYYALRS